MKCYRCRAPAEAQITLEGGRKKPHREYLCLDHFYEVLTVAEMLRRLTGIPEIQQTSEKKERERE